MLIVTRHTGTVAWLRERGLSGRVIEHATREDVEGQTVVGALPFHLAEAADKIGVIDLPLLTVDQRGKDLNPAEMDAAGAELRWYRVEAITYAVGGDDQEYFEYLDSLHSRGVEQMFALYLRVAYPLTQAEADTIVENWRKGRNDLV